MNDQAKFQRMLEILMKLSGPYGYSVKQLADDFESSERTIYRYLTTFKNAGFLIDSTNGYFKIDKKSNEYKDLTKFSSLFRRGGSYSQQGNPFDCISQKSSFS